MLALYMSQDFEARNEGKYLVELSRRPARLSLDGSRQSWGVSHREARSILVLPVPARATRWTQVETQFVDAPRLVLYPAPSQELEHVLLPRLAERQPVEREVVLELVESCAVDAERVGGEMSLDARRTGVHPVRCELPAPFSFVGGHVVRGPPRVGIVGSQDVFAVPLG